MELTMEQKERFLLNNDHILWSVVHKFKRKMRGGFDNQEDLHSECVIAYLDYLQSCSTEEELLKIPVLNMVNAMCCFVLGEQAVTYPKRTTNFGQVMNMVAGCTKYSALERNSDVALSPIDDTLDEIMFRDFCGELTPTEQRVADLKLEGKKNCEIARALDISNASVTRTIHRMKEAYQKKAS